MAQRGLFAVLIVLIVAFMLTSLGLAYVALNSSSHSINDQPETLYIPSVAYSQPAISAENDPYKTTIVELGSSRHRSNRNDDDENDTNSEPRFDLTSNLGLHLKFDESNGATSFTDSSSGAAASCSETECPLSASGRYGNAASFSGSDLVSASNRASLHSNSSLTIASWVYIENFSGPWATVMSKINGPLDCQSTDDCSNREYGVWVQQEGFIEFDVTTANNVNRAKSSCWTDGGVVRVGEWAHIVAVADVPNQVMQIYVNGDLKAECSEPYLRYGIRTSDQAATIGRMLNAEWSHGQNAALNGLLDDLRYYQNRALDSVEVRALYRL